MYSDPESCRTYSRGATNEQRAAEARIVQSTYKVLAEEIDRQKEIDAANGRSWLACFCVILATIIIIVLGLWISKAHAETVDVEKLATAIYYAEGGAKTSHPYGVLVHYKHTTPRQAAINTINHALRDWNGKGDFVSFLGRRYCPVGAKNDPRGLNRNWIRNVKHFMEASR
jgi:hypothetical protein